MPRLIACLLLMFAVAWPGVSAGQETKEEGTADAPTAETTTSDGESEVADEAGPADDSKAGAGEDEADLPRISTRISPEQKKRLYQAINDIVAEAEKLDEYEGEIPDELQAQFRRPNTSLRGMGADAANEALRRMMRPFTGNEFRDTYVRWHLMFVVKQADQAQREESGPMLVRLLRGMPGSLQVGMKQERKHVPEELWKKYWSLINPLRRTVGYPPFQRTVHPPKSFELMSGGELEKAKAAWEAAQEIRPELKVLVDKNAVAFNRRVRQINYLMRRYRGELVYEILRTGDPAMLKLIVNTIVGRVGESHIVAFDLLSFMYLAAFDGVLNQYPKDLLVEASRILERAAGSNQQYREYSVGPVHVNESNWTQRRNFGDYCFHMVHMLRDPHGLDLFEEIAKAEDDE